MNKKEMMDEFLNILYNAQINEQNYPKKEIENFENKIGKAALHELIISLREQGLTNLNSMMGAQGHTVTILATPFLTLDAVDYIKKLKKPFWKKINCITIIGIIVMIIWGVMSFIPNIDKFINNINTYIIPFFIK